MCTLSMTLVMAWIWLVALVGAAVVLVLVALRVVVDNVAGLVVPVALAVRVIRPFDLDR